MGETRISAEHEVAQAIRLEYELLRHQIGAMDQTCVVILGVLISGTVSIVGVALERPSAAVAWFLAPLWAVGHMYLTEKRLWILRTGDYIRREVEPRHEGLGWERWVIAQATPFARVRRSPFALETTLAALAVAVTPVLVLSLAGWELSDAWFLSSLVVALLAAALLAASSGAYAAARAIRLAEVEQRRADEP